MTVVLCHVCFFVLFFCYEFKQPNEHPPRRVFPKFLPEAIYAPCDIMCIIAVVVSSGVQYNVTRVFSLLIFQVDEAESFLSSLSMEVQRRLHEAGLQGRRVTLKVMVRKEGAPQETAKYGGHGICDNFAK